MTHIMDLSHCLDVNYKVCLTNRLFFHQIKYKNLLTHWLLNFDVVFFILTQFMRFGEFIGNKLYHGSYLHGALPCTNQ